MLDIGKVLLKAIVNNYWCKIEYKKDNEVTKFMIGINYIDEKNRTIKCDAFNLMYNADVQKNYVIYFDKIIYAENDEGTYHKTPDNLLELVKKPDFFSSMLRLSVSNDDLIKYYIDCFKLDSTPYISKYGLIKGIDDDVLLKNDIYPLNDEQFKILASESFYKKERKEKKRELNLEKIERNYCVNVLAIEIGSKKQKYILAYRPLVLDFEHKCLISASEEVYKNSEFILDNNTNNVKEVMSINKFIPEDKQYLLDDFYHNLNEIKDVILDYNGSRNMPYNKSIKIDDLPYIINLERKLAIDVDYEFDRINKVINNEEETPLPLKVFLDEPDIRLAKRINYPIFTVNNLYDIDQINAINIAMKSPASYIQGPPGTGKTQTILNAIFTALFNNKTVLVTSNNNIPMDGIYNAINKLKYNDKFDLLFPAIRLGSIENVENAILKINQMYEIAKNLNVKENRIKDIKEERKAAMKNLVDLLDKNDIKKSLEYRIEALENFTKTLNLESNLMSIYASDSIQTLKNELSKYENITDDFTKYMNINHAQLFTAINFETAGRLQKLSKERYSELFLIINDANETNKKEKAIQLRKFLSNNTNLKLFLEIFPVIISTNLSCTYLGEPGTTFDIVMMDEAAQCSITNALIPISRGNQIMLVGDAQQLSPVILLDEKLNKKLMNKYNIPEEYNYVSNSIYTAYTKIDVCNNETLLCSHYRCDEKIISFSNKKYYNNKLKCKRIGNSNTPLEYRDTSKYEEITDEKNISTGEVKAIETYIKEHPNEQIGIITPFVKQKEYLEENLSKTYPDIPIGTVHAFQGDQQNVILFSTAITNKTSKGTYNWLKNNKELINVAMSRAKDKFVMFANKDKISKLSDNKDDDNIKELSDYVYSNGNYVVKNISPASYALGTKQLNTPSEKDLQETFNQILSVIDKNCIIKSEVPVSSIFTHFKDDNSLFYKGRFDLVIFDKTYKGEERVVAAVELNGPEHYSEEQVQERDKLKQQICDNHHFTLYTVKREYARDYRRNKEALIEILNKSK